MTKLSNLEVVYVSVVSGYEQGYTVELDIDGKRYSTYISHYANGWFILEDYFYKKGGERPSKFKEEKFNAALQFIKDELKISNDKPTYAVGERPVGEDIIEISKGMFSIIVEDIKGAIIKGKVNYYNNMKEKRELVYKFQYNKEDETFSNFDTTNAVHTRLNLNEMNIINILFGKLQDKINDLKGV